MMWRERLSKKIIGRRAVLPMVARIVVFVSDSRTV